MNAYAACVRETRIIQSLRARARALAHRSSAPAPPESTLNAAQVTDGRDRARGPVVVCCCAGVPSSPCTRYMYTHIDPGTSAAAAAAPTTPPSRNNTDAPPGRRRYVRVRARGRYIYTRVYVVRACVQQNSTRRRRRYLLIII